MWMTGKLIGMGCILLSGYLLGAELESGLKRRWIFLREMQELLTYLEKEMGYHRSTMPEAFLEASGRCTSQLGPMLKAVSQQIQRPEGIPFQSIWESAVEEYVPKRLLSDDGLRLVKETAAAFCSPDTVMQKMLIQKYADRFWDMSREGERMFREKGKLYRKLAAAAGVFLVLILV